MVPTPIKRQVDCVAGEESNRTETVPVAGDTTVLGQAISTFVLGNSASVPDLSHLAKSSTGGASNLTEMKSLSTSTDVLEKVESVVEVLGGIVGRDENN